MIRLVAAALLLASVAAAQPWVGSTNAKRIQGRPVCATTPSTAEVLAWNGSCWAPAAAASGGTPTGAAGGALSGTYPDPTINYTSPATGGVARSLSSKLGDSVNVKDFGAVGDSSHDDTTNIAAALTAACAVGAWGETGMVVNLPPGVFKITATLTPCANTTIRGAGSGSTFILPTGAIGTVIDINVNGVVIEDLRIDGQEATGTKYGVKIGGTVGTFKYNNTLRRVHIRSFTDGVRLLNCVYTRIVESIILSNSNAGIKSVAADYITTLWLTDNEIGLNGVTGVELSASTASYEVHFSGGSVENDGTTDVILGMARGVVMNGVYHEGSGGSTTIGVNVTGAEDVVIKGGYFYQFQYGIYGTAAVTNLEVSHCRFDMTKGSPRKYVSLTGAKSTGVRIYDNVDSPGVGYTVGVSANEALRSDQVINGFFITDEFMGGIATTGLVGSLGWSYVTGTPTIRDTASFTGHPGVWRYTSSATANAVSQFYLGTGQNAFAFNVGDNFDYTWVVSGTDVGTNSSYRVGILCSAVLTDPPTKGIFFEKLTGDSAWFVVTRNTTQTRTTTGVTAVNDTYVRLRGRRIDGSTIGFSVNGAAEITHTATIPSASSCTPTAQVIPSTTTTVALDIDYFGLSIAGLAR